MKPYGLKRNWNDIEDNGKWGRAYKQATHRASTKRLHRTARRTAKHLLKNATD